jgi:alkanesulfonate monooxygenase
VPVRLIGMIGVAPAAGTSLHVIGGGVSPTFLGEFAQAHEQAGFDLVLVGYYSSSAEGFAVASYAAARTARLGYLVAHRPAWWLRRLRPALSPPLTRCGAGA